MKGTGTNFDVASYNRGGWYPVLPGQISSASPNCRLIVTPMCNSLALIGSGKQGGVIAHFDLFQENINEIAQNIFKELERKNYSLKEMKWTIAGLWGYQLLDKTIADLYERKGEQIKGSLTTSLNEKGIEVDLNNFKQFENECIPELNKQHTLNFDAIARAAKEQDTLSPDWKTHYPAIDAWSTNNTIILSSTHLPPIIDVTREKLTEIKNSNSSQQMEYQHFRH